MKGVTISRKKSKYVNVQKSQQGTRKVSLGLGDQGATGDPLQLLSVERRDTSQSAQGAGAWRGSSRGKEQKERGCGPFPFPVLLFSIPNTFLSGVGEKTAIIMIVLMTMTPWVVWALGT